MSRTQPASTPVVLALFALSGFAGIIYESIWSHYLKLFLGHAAYAQTLVLVMFMGGMAFGAWLASRIDGRIYDLLKVYIAVEILIGIAGFVFHDIYLGVTHAAYTTLFPGLGNAAAVEFAKTLLAAMLILPQSLLLGMTFPLMTVGLLQRAPAASGRTIASLYFVNSLGAAIGILVSGFVLLAWVGLPGTIRIAATINVAVAFGLALVLMTRGVPARSRAMASGAHSVSAGSGIGALMLFVALGTGAASFIYEIVWIRLLSMVLGASTHSFELMLSAFILGLALGSAWIRRHIGSIRHPLAVLGFIQLAMGTLALATIMFYDFSFTLMAAALLTLAKTSLGYVAFTLTSHAIALLIMLPVTICAGMTLPLITQALIAAKHGERSVGRVYASNTVGAIVGVIVTVHVLIPLLNLERALYVGAAIDLIIGAVLLVRWLPRSERRVLVPTGLAVFGFFLFAVLFVDVDPRKMAAGVYRTGVAEIGTEARIALRRDGKTSSVTMMQIDATLRVLSTNGKPDASIEFDPDKAPSRDETTQILTGLLPLMAHPQARTIAMIGIGSGQSTHAVLASPHVERVDTIEIEAAMVTGARLFLPAVARAFEDPRSQLVINDARTVLATGRRKYDVIVSEPSNPWVSGVAGLFSTEFYRLAARHLAEGGVFAQWMQTYEIEPELVASVFKALASVFGEFAVYNTDSGNLLIIATADGKLSEHRAALFEFAAARELLDRIDIAGPADLLARRVGDGRLLMPLLNTFLLPANSDFYPYLDLGSAAARYRAARPSALLDVASASVPLRDLFGGHVAAIEQLAADVAAPSTSVSELLAAAAVYAWLVDGDATAAARLPDDRRRLVAAIMADATQCRAAPPRQRDLLQFAQSVYPHLATPRRVRLASRIADRRACVAMDPATRFVHALAAGEPAGIRAGAAALRETFADDPELSAYLLEATLFANLLAAAPDANLALWQHVAPARRAALLRRLPLRLMLAHSGWVGEQP
jgi:spermidine synthase